MEWVWCAGMGTLLCLEGLSQRWKCADFGKSARTRQCSWAVPCLWQPWQILWEKSVGPLAPNILWAWQMWGKLPLFTAESCIKNLGTLRVTSRFLSRGGRLQSGENTNPMNIWCSTGSYSRIQTSRWLLTFVFPKLSPVKGAAFTTGLCNLLEADTQTQNSNFLTVLFPCHNGCVHPLLCLLDPSLYFPAVCLEQEKWNFTQNLTVHSGDLKSSRGLKNSLRLKQMCFL